MSFSNTYNIAKTFSMFPCAEPSPIALFFTLGPAIAPAILEWVTLSCRDIIKARLGHQAPCGRALKGPLAKATPPSWLSIAEKAMKFEGFVSKVGNYFLLADLASDTIARWTTEAYKFEGCPDAFEGATWQYAPGAPHAVLPNTPTPISGVLIHEKGQPGVAWPSGAVAPEDWFLSMEFSVIARSLSTGKNIEVSQWVRQTGTGGYDFPASKTSPGYGGLERQAHYAFKTRAPRSSHLVQYVFTVMTSELALVTLESGTGQCTPFPQDEWGISPLSCFTNLLKSTVENPAGRNKVSSFPTILGVKTSSILPKPVRGTPGGKPRSKK